MRVFLPAGFFAVLFVSVPASASNHLLTIINDGNGALDSIAYAPTGTDRWFTAEGGAVEGNGGEATVAMPASSCVFDFRVRLKGQSPLAVKAWNVCQEPVMHVGRRQPQDPLLQG
jgi:hypothetical protein